MAAVAETSNRVRTLADLKQQPVAENASMLLQCRTVIGDGFSGVYVWDAASTAPEDLTNLSVVASSLTSTGRWIKLSTPTRTLTHGVLTQNGQIRTFWATGLTDVNGRLSANLTLDGTAGGTALFSSILKNQGYSRTPTTSLNDLVEASLYAQAADLKTTTHQYYKAPATLTLNLAIITAGLNFNARQSAGQNVAVGIEVVGMAP